jgi:hypothetical protein
MLAHNANELPGHPGVLTATGEFAMSDKQVLSYQSQTSTSSAAKIVFVLAILTIPVFFLLFPPGIMLLLSLIVVGQLRNTMDTRGQRFAAAAAMISFGGVILWVALLVLMPSNGHRGLSNRSVCAANLKGIVQSMNVYGNDWNDAYPIVQYAPYSAGLNDARAAPGDVNADETIRNYFRPPFRQAGSVQATLWQLVLRGDVSPKSFICPDDKGPRGTPSILNAPSGTFYDNFQSGQNLTYSVAYPWTADGKVGKWWGATIDASLPIMADATPEHGTGTPVRNLTPAALPTNSHTWNSASHAGDGQNVAFADNHVEFVRSPNCGQDNDNIYSTSALLSKAPAQFGGIPASKWSPQLTADKPPFDIVMVPVRNATTGGY